MNSPLLPLLAALAGVLAATATPGAARELVLSPRVDFFALDSDLDGRPDAANGTSPNLAAGRLPNGALARPVLVFDLPADVPAESLVSARLRLGLLSNELEHDARVVLRHSRTFARTGPTPAAFADGSFVDTGLVAAERRARRTASIDLDVTDRVRADLREDPAGSALAAFRLELSAEGGPPASRMVFASSRNETAGKPPVLVLTVAP